MSVSPSEFFYADVSYVDTSNALINFSNLTGNAELNEHPLSKYARGIFFSPNYNKQFFDAINWANNLGAYKTQLNLINPFNNSILENLFGNIPSAYPEGIIAYYLASDIDIENNSWPDRSGNNNATLVGTGFSTSTDGLALQGTTSSSILFGNILNTEYTICSITSYSGTNKKTILNSADANWIHGHYNGRSGVIAYELDRGITPTVALDLTSSTSVMYHSQDATFSAEGMHQIQGNYALATPFEFGTPFTISTRVKWDIMLPYNYIVELRDDYGFGYTDGVNVIRIGPWHGNKLHYGQRIGTSWSSLETTMTLNTNTWYDIIVTHSGSEVNIYIDGVEVRSGSLSAIDSITREIHAISYPNPEDNNYPQGSATVKYVNFYNDVYPPNALQPTTPPVPDVHPPAPPSITLVGSIDTPSSINATTDYGDAPIPFTSDTMLSWNGLKPDKDWSLVLKTDARCKLVVRWGNEWWDARFYIAENYGWNASADGIVKFGWTDVISIGVMGIPGDESARAHINSMSFAFSYDSALYQSDPANFTSITTGPQTENAALKLYLKIGDGEWTFPDIVTVSHKGLPVDNAPPHPSTLKAPYYADSYYGNAFGGASRIDEFELYNGIWTPPAPSTSSTSTETESFWTVTCGTNAIASDGTQSILVNGNNITPVLEQEFPYNDHVYKIDNTIEGISVNVPGSQLGGWAGSLEKDCGIYFKVETNSSGWQGNILGLLTHNPSGAYSFPIMQAWQQANTSLGFQIVHSSGNYIITYVPFTVSPSTVYEIYITWHAMSSSHPTAPDFNDFVFGIRESGGNWVTSTGNDGNNKNDKLELSNNENFSVENNIATTVLGINGNGDINNNGGNPGNKIIDFRLYNKYLDHNESAPASVYGSDGNISVNINNGNSSDFSDFAIKELIVWPRALTTDEMKSVSDYMIANLNSPVFNVPPILPPTGFVEVNGATWSQGRLQGFGYSIGSFGQGDTVQGVQFKTELGTDTMIGLTYSVPISDPIGGWAQGGYMIYPHQGNTVYVYDGPTSKGNHSTLDNNTQIWQIRVNINSRVELVKNGTIFYTFDSPSATAWSGGTQLYVVITWRPSNTYDWQWINASGEPVGDIWI